MITNRMNLFLRLFCLHAVTAGLALRAQPVQAQALAWARFPRQQPQAVTDAPRASQRRLKDVLNELRAQYKVDILFEEQAVEGIFVNSDGTATGEKFEKRLEKLLRPSGLRFRKVRDGAYLVLARRPERKTALLDARPLETTGGTAARPEGVFGSHEALTALKPTEIAVLEPVDLTIRGKVTDGETNAPVPGATIAVKNTNRGTTTDANGDYRLAVPDENAVLVVSSVGYDRQEITVGNRSIVNIALKQGVTTLQEVVAVGYGTQRRASVTGAISSVSSKEISELSVPSVEQAIQGRVAGVQVTNNGSPGESPIVRIRGIGSINYASNPLYVVDGFPTGDLNNFDTKDIESVEVLKDASSAAIYGSRAANGVIIITTKKGRRDGKLHVEYNGYAGTQSAWRKLDLLNRDQYIQYATTLLNNAGSALPTRFGKLNDPIYPGATQTYAQTDTDWQSAVFRAAPISQHQVSLSGGNERSRLFTSFGYFNQQGIMLGTGYKRGNFRINADHTISKVFTFGENLTVSYDDKQNENNGGGRSQLKHIVHMTPYIPILDPTLPGGYRGPDGSDGTDPQNPVRIALQDRDNTQRLKFLGSAFVEAKITPWLRYRFTGGVDYVSARQTVFQPIYNESFNARALANLQDNRSTYTSTILTNQLTFEKTFGKHAVNATLVAERQDGKSTYLNGAGSAASNDIKEMSALISSSVGIQGGRSENVLFSYLGRVNYEYAGKYLLSASFRRDGSSRFAPGNKWGNFPSVSAGWRLSEEAFMKNVPAISELKLRASYGSTGFNGIGDYAWQVAVSQNTNAILGDQRTQGTYFDRLGNTNLKWEVTKMTNVGLDVGLLRNQVTFSMEVYNRQTDGLILNQPIAPSIGYSNPPTVNVGSMKNWGYEFQAGYAKRTGDFRFDVSGNLSVVRNKVLSLGPGISPLFAGQNADFGGFDITKTEAGQPIQSFYGWKVAGIFQSQEEIKNSPTQSNAKPGDIKFADINGDGKIDASDRTYLGSFLPNFTYGLNFSASYRNFDASLFFQGVQGNKIYNGVKVLTQGMLRLFNAGTDVLRAWTPQNTNTDVPRAVSGDPNNNSRTSDRFLEDGSYLRLKNLTIGYSLPSTLLQNWTRGTLSRVRLYVQAQNLLTFTKYTGYDPEIGSRFNNTLASGIDYGQFPQARTLMAGVQLGF